MDTEFYKYFTYAIVAVISVVTFIDNQIILYIYTRNQFLRQSMARFFIVLSIVGNFSPIVLILESFPIVLKYIPQPIGCKVFNLCAYAIYQFATWIVSFVGFDLLLSMKFPFWKLREKFSYQAFILAILVVTSTVTATPYYTYSTYNLNTTYVCTINSSAAYYVNIFNIISIVIAPFTVNILCTIGIVTQLQNSKRRSNCVTDERCYRKQVKFFKLLIMLDVYFLVCNMPYFIAKFLSILTEDDYNYHSWWLFTDLLKKLIYGYYSFSIVIHLSFNKMFRNYFMSMMGFKSYRNRLSSA